MPLASNSLIRPASLYLPGGSVNFSTLSKSNNFNFCPTLHFGNSTSSPLASLSTLSHPGKSKREPVAEKSGITSSRPSPCRGEGKIVFAVISRSPLQGEGRDEVIPD